MTTIRTTTHPLTGPTSLEDFMGVLEARRDAYYDDKPHIWAKYPVADFYLPEDDAWIIPPAPQETAPAANKPHRGPEYHQRLLDAAEARLEKARARVVEAYERERRTDPLRDVPKGDQGPWSGFMKGREKSRRGIYSRQDSALTNKLECEAKVRALEATCAHHRANLTRAQQRSTP